MISHTVSFFEPHTEPEIELFDRAALNRADAATLFSIQEFRSMLAITLQWAVIFLTIQMSIHFHHWSTYGLAVIIIASRQHALGSLLHEASHYLLFKNHRLNDLAAQLCLAFPLGIGLRMFRKYHFNHHRRPGEEKTTCPVDNLDTQRWVWPKSKKDTWLFFMSTLTGFKSHQIIKALLTVSPFVNINCPKREVLAERIFYLSYWGCILFMLTAFHWWPLFLFFWIIPLFTVFNALLVIRNTSEHLLLHGDHELNVSRNIKTSWLDRLLFAPFNMNYHLVHHLYPTVPGYNLPKLHKILMQNPVYKEKAGYSEYYLAWGKGVLHEMSSAL